MSPHIRAAEADRIEQQSRKLGYTVQLTDDADSAELSYKRMGLWLWDAPGVLWHDYDGDPQIAIVPLLAFLAQENYLNPNAMCDGLIAAREERIAELKSASERTGAEERNTASLIVQWASPTSAMLSQMCGAFDGTAVSREAVEAHECNPACQAIGLQRWQSRLIDRHESAQKNLAEIESEIVELSEPPAL